MSPSADLADRTLRAFCDDLAARTPTPGGGSVAAYLVACGASLVAMACRFTSGEKFAVVDAAMQQRALELDVLRARAIDLVDLDTRSYDAVTAAYKLPKSNDVEKAARSSAIQAGLRGALEVPAETISRALAALRIAASAAADVNSNLASDCGAGSACLRSAAEAALDNVRINAASIADKAWAAERLDQARRSVDEARTLHAAVRAGVEAKLG